MENLKQKLTGLELQSYNDLIILESICEEIKAKNCPIEMLEPLLQILETNSNFDFGMPTNIIHTIERYYSVSNTQEYESFLFKSIERSPTTYNLWLLNQLLNTAKEDTQIEKYLSVFRKIQAESKDSEVLESIQLFLSNSQK